MQDTSTLLLVDGSSYLYRAFHAMPDLRADRNDPHSQATGAIRGMVNMLQSLRKDWPTAHAVCVFDAKGPTFRDAIYPAYKATRSPMPDVPAAPADPLRLDFPDDLPIPGRLALAKAYIAQENARIRALHEHVARTADHVGENFATEARRMHYGETEQRAIYGEASLTEARSLLEEGIAVQPLPSLPDDRN